MTYEIHIKKIFNFNTSIIHISWDMYHTPVKADFILECRIVFQPQASLV